MKILHTLVSSTLYELRQIFDEVEIWKEGEFKYIVNLTTKHCTCPGFIHHKKCWHVRDIPSLMNKAIICNEPWAQWAEEAVIEQSIFKFKWR